MRCEGCWNTVASIHRYLQVTRRDSNATALQATGVIAPGAAFDALGFLESLPEVHLAFQEA